MIKLGCGCGKKSNVTRQFRVDLAGTEKTFTDGSTVKVYSSQAEANIAIAKVGLTGKVRPSVVIAK